MKKILILLTFVLVSSSLFSLSDAIDNTTLYNVALGGAHTGMVKGFDSFYNNPALLAKYEKEMAVFRFGLNMKGDAFDILNLYLGDQLSSSETSDMVNTLEENGLMSLLIGVNLAGPIYVGQIGNNWGWNIKNSSDVYINLPGLTNTAQITVREDLTFAVGIAVPFKMLLGNSFFIEMIPGVMSRTTIRGEVNVETDLLGMISYFDDVSSITDDNPLYLSPMFALDTGFLFNFYDVVSLSGVVKDIYTPILKYKVNSYQDAFDIFSNYEDTTGKLVYREINFGLAGDIPLGPLVYVISDLDVYLDYFDLLDFDKNVFLHFGLGMDIELLEKFHLLSGFNEGLMALGLNVDLGGFNIGFAMYGSEEGTQPGANTVFNFLLSMGISF